MAEGVIDRCPSGIMGFDRISEGGFVRNSDNLLIGGPGTGKTTFLLQFLWNGATKFDESGLYCSFEPDIVETLKDGMAYGWDFSKLSEAGKIKFMRFAPQTTIEELKSELTKVISKHNIRRICFDPVSVLALSQTDSGKMRQTIFELSSLMKRLKVTSVLADETMEGEGLQPRDGEWSRTDILRFLSDSVTILYESGVAEVGDRAIRIAKMRRTNHERKAVGMRISRVGMEVALLGTASEESHVKTVSIELPVKEATQGDSEYFKKVQKQLEEAKMRALHASEQGLPRTPVPAPKPLPSQPPMPNVAPKQVMTAPPQPVIPRTAPQQAPVPRPLPAMTNAPREEYQKKVLQGQQGVASPVEHRVEDMHESGVKLQRPYMSSIPEIPVVHSKPAPSVAQAAPASKPLEEELETEN